MSESINGDYGKVQHVDGRVGVYDDDLFQDKKELAVVYFPDMFIDGAINEEYELVDYKDITKISEE